MRLPVLLVLLRCLASFANVVQSLPHLAHSPLDGPSTTLYDEMHNPECNACTSPFFDTVQSMMTPGSYVDRLDSACKSYDSAMRCVEKSPDCSSGLFSSMTSGLHYMCVEQRQAFNSVIGCIDMNADTVHDECMSFCHPSSLMTGMAVKSTFFDGNAMFNKYVDLQKLIDPHLAALVIGEGCRIGECVLTCYRTKFNARCEGSAGSLIVEAAIRPLTGEGASSISPILSAFLPPQCAVLTNQKALSALRLDPQIENDLKRVYKEKKEAPRADKKIVDSIFEQPAHNPFDDSRFQQPASPIDTHAEGYFPLGKHRTMDDEEDDDDVEYYANDTLTHTQDDNSTVKINRVTRQLEEFETTDPPPRWMDVADRQTDAGGRIKVFHDGSTSDMTVLNLHRTQDNADFYISHRILSNHKYRIDVEVHDDDEGELVCVLRTDKAFGVNRIPKDKERSDEFDDLLADM